MSLHLRGVSVTIGRHPVVHDVDIIVPTGHVVGLIGPNGSGKSTLLKAVYRAVPLHAGTVLIDDAPLLSMPRRQAARRLAVLSQTTHMEFDATVREVVMLGRVPHQRAFGRDSHHDSAVVERCLDQVGCAHLAGRSIHALSGGEQQRVYVARVLAQESDHLVLDEPTNHLDIKYQAHILELVTRLGLTVLTALHDLSLASLYCDEVYLMGDGRVAAHGAPRDVITPQTVRSVYDADVLVIDHPQTGVPQVLARRHTAP